MKSHALASILSVLALAAAPSRATAQTNILPASGNVGIGTTGPDYELEIGALSAGEPTLLMLDGNATKGVQMRIGDIQGGSVGTRYSGADAYLASNAYQSSYGVDFWTKGASAYGSAVAVLGSSPTPTNPAFQIRYAPANTAAGGFSSLFASPLLTVLGNGNVGIGTQAPGSALEVNGNITLTGAYSLLNSSGYQSIILKRLRSSTGNSTSKTFMEYYGNADGSLAVGAAYVNANIVFGTNNAADNFHYTSTGQSGGVWYFNGLGTAFAAALAIPDTIFTVHASGNAYTVICSSNQAVYVKETIATQDLTPGQLDNIVYSPERMRIAKGGYVGIGTIAPTYPLTVNGTVRAKEVIVDTGWSDHVFAPDRRLAPLAEVEAAIKADRHLPGIPSQGEVAANGVSVGDMQARLLEKIEELTLYLIAQEKRIRGLEDENRQLRGCPSIHENP